MNRIFTFVIVAPLIFAGSSAFAQRLPQSTRQVQQQTGAILYATERASNVPTYRRYRPPSIADAPRTAPRFNGITYPRDTPQPTFVFTPSSPPQTSEPAPVIRGSSRRIMRIKLPTPETEISVPALDTIEPAEIQADFVKTKTPVNASPNFKRRIGSVFGQEDLQQSQWQPRSELVPREEKITLSLPVEQPQATEAAPVIRRSSRRITRIKAPTPEAEILTLAPDAIEPAEIQAEFAKTRIPAKASPNFKYRSPSVFGQEDLQQSQWKPRPKQVQHEEKIALSSPGEPLQTIDLPILFEAATPVVSAEHKAIAVPLKGAPLGSEESPFTSVIAATVTPPTVETESRIKAVAQIDSAATGLATKAKVGTRRKVHRSAGKETSRQRKATGAWWFFLPLLLVPFLAWLGWTRIGGERYSQFEDASMFEEAPTIDIPLQNNTPWQVRESTDAELSCPVAAGTDSREIYSTHEGSDALESELLDELNSIRAIPSISNSAASPTSDARAKSENR